MSLPHARVLQDQAEDQIDATSAACAAVAEAMLPSDCTVQECQKRIARCVSQVLESTGETPATSAALVPMLHFVAQTVAVNHDRSDIGWFKGCLEGLLEIAAPSRQVSGKAFEFLRTVLYAAEGECAKGPGNENPEKKQRDAPYPAASKPVHGSHEQTLPTTWTDSKEHPGEWLAPDLYTAIASRLPNIKLRRQSLSFQVIGPHDKSPQFIAMLRWGYEKAAAMLKSGPHSTYQAALDEVVDAAKNVPADEFDPLAMIRQAFHGKERPFALEFVNTVPVGIPRFTCKAYFGSEPAVRTRSSLTMSTRREAFVNMVSLERQEVSAPMAARKPERQGPWWEMAARHGLRKSKVTFTEHTAEALECQIEWQLPTGKRACVSSQACGSRAKAFDFALTLALIHKNNTSLDWKKEVATRAPGLQDVHVVFGDEGDGHSCFVLWAHGQYCCKGVGPSQLQAFESSCEMAIDSNSVLSVLWHVQRNKTPPKEMMARTMKVVAASVQRWTSVRNSLLGSESKNDREKLLRVSHYLEIRDPQATRNFTHEEKSAILLQALQDIADELQRSSRALRKESMSKNMRADAEILTAMLSNGAPAVEGARLSVDDSVKLVCDRQGLSLERAIESMSARQLILRAASGALRLDARGATLVQEVTDTRPQHVGSVGVSAHSALMAARAEILQQVSR